MNKIPSDNNRPSLMPSATGQDDDSIHAPPTRVLAGLSPQPQPGLTWQRSVLWGVGILALAGGATWGAWTITNGDRADAVVAKAPEVSAPSASAVPAPSVETTEQSPSSTSTPAPTNAAAVIDAPAPKTEAVGATALTNQGAADESSSDVPGTAAGLAGAASAAVAGALATAPDNAAKSTELPKATTALDTAASAATGAQADATHANATGAPKSKASRSIARKSKPKHTALARGGKASAASSKHAVNQKRNAKGGQMTRRVSRDPDSDLIAALLKRNGESQPERTVNR